MNRKLIALSAALLAAPLLISGCSSEPEPADVTPTVAPSDMPSPSSSAETGIEDVMDSSALAIAFLDTVSVQLQAQMSDGSAPSIGITNGDVTVAGVPVGPVPSTVTLTVLTDTSGSSACVSVMGPSVEPPQARLVRPGGVENVALCPTDLTSLIVAETGA